MAISHMLHSLLVIHADVSAVPAAILSHVWIVQEAAVLPGSVATTGCFTNLSFFWHSCETAWTCGAHCAPDRGDSQMHGSCGSFTVILDGIHADNMQVQPAEPELQAGVLPLSRFFIIVPRFLTCESADALCKVGGDRCRTGAGTALPQC
jgi:hypothetical protein